MKFPLGEYHKTSLVISQHWFYDAYGVTRPQWVKMADKISCNLKAYQLLIITGQSNGELLDYWIDNFNWYGIATNGSLTQTAATVIYQIMTDY